MIIIGRNGMITSNSNMRRQKKRPEWLEEVLIMADAKPKLRRHDEACA
jgi:hypothetical protein